jgi:hypothetical protein
MEEMAAMEENKSQMINLMFWPHIEQQLLISFYYSFDINKLNQTIVGQL